MDKLWHKHWPVGLPKSLDYPEVPVYTFLESSAKKFPNHDAIVFQGARFTYSQLLEKAERFATALAALGVKKGDVVALHMPNCPQFLIAYYGALRAGATFSPCNPALTPRELEYQLNDCQATVVVTFDLIADHILSVATNTRLELIIVTGFQESVPPHLPVNPPDGTLGFQALLVKYAPNPPVVEINPATDLAHLAYTGGTTGVSKGVMVSHLKVVTNVLQYAHWGMGGRPVYEDGIFKTVDSPQYMGDHWEYSSEVEPQGRNVVVTPWFHAMGTVGFLNMQVYGGSTMWVHTRFDPISFLDDAEKAQATSVGGAPPLFVALLNTPNFSTRNFSSVKVVSSGAAPLAVELLNKLKENFPNAIILEGYGLTEVTMGATSNPANWSGLRKVGSVGIPVFDTDVKIVDLENGDKEMPIGTEGEICIRGPQVMLGYLNKPEATAEVLRDGWLHSGDIGFMDEDGYVTIVDRKKDMLIYKGYNVYPRELEELLFQHPAVANCAVIGLPDMNVGEIPKAYVVVRPGFTVSPEEIIKYIEEKVVPYKKLRDVEFIDQIPVSAAGKVLKRQLREMAKKV
ncbi:MAG: long-chain-fatty-acid--CoA ligase [Bacillota bacterium]